MGKMCCDRPGISLPWRNPLSPQNTQSCGGGDEYANLVLVSELVHKLLHAQRADVVTYYLDLLKFTSKQMQALNKLRVFAGLPEIAQF